MSKPYWDRPVLVPVGARVVTRRDRAPDGRAELLSAPGPASSTTCMNVPN